MNKALSKVAGEEKTIVSNMEELKAMLDKKD